MVGVVCVSGILLCYLICWYSGLLILVCWVVIVLLVLVIVARFHCVGFGWCLWFSFLVCGICFRLRFEFWLLTLGVGFRFGLLFGFGGFGGFCWFCFGVGGDLVVCWVRTLGWL